MDRVGQRLLPAGYLAPDLVGGPIADKRLCSVSDNGIVFNYKDHRDGKEKQMSLSPNNLTTSVVRSVIRWGVEVCVSPAGLEYGFQKRNSSLIATALNETP